MVDNLLEYLKNKKIVILGFGKEGKSTYNYIRKKFPDMLLTIADSKEELRKEVANDKNVIFDSKEEYLNNIDEYDLIIKSPGIPFKQKDISKYENKITSQLALFLDFINVYTIGVTGTKGKSTTSSLIYKILKEQDIDSLLLGNIGDPIFDNLDIVHENMKVVLELSSHQLEYVKKSTNISILLNIFEEHLDHYKSFDKYIEAKFNIFKYQKESDFAIYNIDNEMIKQRYNDIKSKKYCITKQEENIRNDSIYCRNNMVYFNGKELYDLNQKRNIIGKHNEYNIMFALGTSEILHLDLDKTIKSISAYEPLPHRMEFVGIYNDIKFYNDSIATVPEAVISCIETLTDMNTLIIGGMDRGVNVSKFIDYLINSNIENIICMPDTGIYIANQIIDKKIESPKIYKVENLTQAVELSKRITRKGTSCVLSPAAVSYGFFKNFEERGETFKKLVKE